MNQAPATLATAGLVIIHQKQVLLAFSSRKKAFYLPGGKIDKGEMAMTALIREAEEELGIRLSPHQLQYYCHITAPAYGEEHGLIMEQDCFLLTTAVTPVAMAEISELRYFTETAYQKEPAQVPGVVILFEQLKKDGLL